MPEVPYTGEDHRKSQPIGGFDQNELLRLIASLERASEHPLAAAIVKGAEDCGLKLAVASEFNAETGKGVIGTVDGRRIAVGNDALFAALGIDPDGLPEKADALRRDGQGVMLIAVDGRPAGLAAVADPIKEGAIGALGALREEGIRVVMLTGINDLEVSLRARAAGATAYVIKGCSFDELLTAIRAPVTVAPAG